MGSSLFAGVSGLNASSKQMDVIGNNIANVNTVGYKSSKTYFGDILSQSMAGGGSQIGRGVSVNDVSTQFSLGSFETTANATDLAIEGDGFFMVSDSDGGNYYTRAGAFNIDSTGYLVDVNGYKVQGYNLSGSDPNTITDISLQNVQSAPEATSMVSFGLNLDAEALVDSTFNAAQTVYDSMGAAHTLETTFTKTALGWDFQTSLDGDETIIAQSVGSVTFDSDGVLATPADADVTLTFAAPLDSGATIGDELGVVTWDLTSDSAEAVTGYASTSAVTSLTSDGFSSGILQDLSVMQDGILSGFFTNGQTADVGQIVLANFANSGGLKRSGNSLFAETNASGSAIQNKPGAAGMGTINSNSLEMSNTDIATEFVNMITAQRAYQANAKVITTTDSMMSELMNIKR